MASAASVRMAVPSVCVAMRTASARLVRGCCSRSRTAQNPSARATASRSARAGSLSVTTTLREQRPGTSVNGLPMNMPAARPPGLASMAWAWRMKVPSRPVAVISSFPRTSAGMVTTRRDGPHGAGQDAQEQPRRPLARLEEIHVGIGVIHRDGVGVLEHAVGQDAVQVERDHDGDLLAEDLARLGQQKSLGVVLALGLHGAVEGKVDGVHGRRRSDRVQELAGDPVEVRRRQDPAGGDGAGTVGGDDLDVGLCREDAEGARHLAPDPRVAAEQLGPDGDAEVLVVTRDRIERG